MTSNYQELSKKINKAKRELGEIEKNLKESESLEKDLDKNAFQIEEKLKRVEEVLSKLKVLEELQANLITVKEFVEERKKLLDAPKHKLRIYLGAELQRRLQEKGWRVEGNLPELKVGLLTLEFLLSRGQVRIWYGPRIEQLGQVKLVIDEVVNSVIKTFQALETSSFKDEHAFLKLLFEAYLSLIKKDGLEMSTNISVVRWLGEIAWSKQDRDFLCDPRREYFKSYSRTQLSYDLSRLTRREFESNELRLVVASREQTKKRDDNLWIPTSPRGEGTHFSEIGFRPRH